MKKDPTPQEKQPEQEGSFNFALMLIAVIGIAIVLLIVRMVGIL